MSRVLPPVMQFCYVVDDLSAAMAHWARIMQVGPFFLLANVRYRSCLYQGEESPIDMSVAIAYSGDVQIELVQQHNDAPSIFRDFLNARGPGLQHVGAVTNDLDGSLAQLATRGIRPVQEGEADNGTLFAYVNTDLMPGAMLELFQVPPQVSSAFEFMRRAAQAWDPAHDKVIGSFSGTAPAK